MVLIFVGHPAERTLLSLNNGLCIELYLIRTVLITDSYCSLTTNL